METQPDQVLVVEDDAGINSLLGAYVRLAGFDYRPAFDGSAALAAAHENRPRLILLDLMLPDIDGLEVCRQLKADPLTKAVPIVMITALDDERHRRQGLECGAAEYVPKPFDPDRLLEAIKRLAANGEGQEA